MKVRFLDEIFECEKAVKGSDFVHLLDKNDNVIASFKGVSDFSLFSIEEGEWTSAEAQPTQLDIIEAQVMYTAMMTDTLI